MHFIATEIIQKLATAAELAKREVTEKSAQRQAAFEQAEQGWAALVGPQTKWRENLFADEEAIQQSAAAETRHEVDQFAARKATYLKLPQSRHGETTFPFRKSVSKKRNIERIVVALIELPGKIKLDATAFEANKSTFDSVAKVPKISLTEPEISARTSGTSQKPISRAGTLPARLMLVTSLSRQLTFADSNVTFRDSNDIPISNLSIVDVNAGWLAIDFPSDPSTGIARQAKLAPSQSTHIAVKFIIAAAAIQSATPKQSAPNLPIRHHDLIPALRAMPENATSSRTSLTFLSTAMVTFATMLRDQLVFVTLNKVNYVAECIPC